MEGHCATWSTLTRWYEADGLPTTFDVSKNWCMDKCFSVNNCVAYAIMDDSSECITYYDVCNDSKNGEMWTYQYFTRRPSGEALFLTFPVDTESRNQSDPL